MEIGKSNRHIAETKMNSHSSRSHTILYIYLKSQDQENESCFQIVDLAGTQHRRNIESSESRVSELMQINSDLSSYGFIIVFFIIVVLIGLWIFE